jgi:ABC-type multidrug transport system fused ATPase/permease subunit
MTTSAIPVNARLRIDSDAEPVLEFRNVSISFPGNPVLEDVTFKVAPNETRVLLGRREWERACC